MSVRRFALIATVIALACGRIGESTAPADRGPASVDLFNGMGGAAMMLGLEIPVPVTVRDSSGQRIATPADFSLVSRSPATISIEGGTRMKSRAMGSTWIIGSLSHNGRVIADSVHFSVSCTLELIVVFTPAPFTLGVGESGHASLKLITCGGQIEHSGPWIWSSQHPAIAAVDSLTGRVTGLSVGQTSLTARDAAGRGQSGLGVTVR
jgi:hypothetical protein